MQARRALLFCCLFFVLAVAQVVPPTHPNIYYSGRTQVNSDGSVVYDWPGVQFEFYFNGSTVALLMKELMPTNIENDNSASWLNVVLDGNLVNIFSLDRGGDNDTYVAVDGIHDNNLHHLVITKRTEPLLGIVQFSGVVFPSGGSIHPSPSPPLSRKIEFIGDSITCGFGNEGLAGCQFTAPTENNFHTYEQIIGTQLQAQVFVEAWSGKGVIRNCCNQNITTPNPLPSYYTFSVANYPTSKWEFTTWMPNAVVINLGTNDYSTPPQPPEDLFVTAYINFIAEIRQQYQPTSPTFFLVCGPMIGNPCCEYVQAVAAKTNATYVNLQGVLENPFDYGCDGHPSVSGHYKMANTALPIIQKTMNWS